MKWNGNDAFNQRLELENAKAALVMAGFSESAISNAVLTQSFLRLEQLLVTGQTQFNFPIMVNQTGNTIGTRVTERRLKFQDAFYCSGVEITLLKGASATDTALVPHTYPNPVTFTNGGAGGSAAPLYTFYNGVLRVTVNNSVLIPAYPLTDFLDIPATQLTAATNSPLDALYGAERISTQPNPVFIGQKDSVIQIELPGAISAIDTFTYARIDFRGILAQNVTVVS